MRNKEITEIQACDVPELQVNTVWKKIMGWVSRVHIIYWIIAIILLLALFISLKPDYLFNHIWPRIRAQGHLVALVLVFCVVAVSLIWKTGQRIDIWVFMVFNMRGHRPAWIDKVMLGLTQFGSSAFAFGVALVYLLLSYRHFAYEIILGTLTLWLVVELIKITVRRTRPYAKLKNIRTVGAKERGHSFPSGHTSQAFFMANLMLHYYQVGIAGVLGLYAAALIVGLTRMYVGMHYPRDVLGGAMLGTAWGLLSIVVNNYFY